MTAFRTFFDLLEQANKSYTEEGTRTAVLREGIDVRQGCVLWAILFLAASLVTLKSDFCSFRRPPHQAFPNNHIFLAGEFLLFAETVNEGKFMST